MKKLRFGLQKISVIVKRGYHMYIVRSRVLSGKSRKIKKTALELDWFEMMSVVVHKSLVACSLKC